MRPAPKPGQRVRCASTAVEPPPKEPGVMRHGPGPGMQVGPPPPPHSPIGRVSLAQRGTPYICLSELQPPFWAVRRQERDPPLGGGVPHSKRHNRPHRAWRLCGRRHPDRQMALRALWCARRWGGGGVSGASRPARGWARQPARQAHACATARVGRGGGGGGPRASNRTPPLPQ